MVDILSNRPKSAKSNDSESSDKKRIETLTEEKP